MAERIAQDRRQSRLVLLTRIVHESTTCVRFIAEEKEEQEEKEIYTMYGIGLNHARSTCVGGQDTAKSFGQVHICMGPLL